jgi:hypothetical protein
MKVLTQDALLLCKHGLGKVAIQASQTWVTVEKRAVLVQPDPQGKTISGCPNYGPMIKPCTTTLVVEQGYSTYVRIDGRPVCLDTVTGLTDGTPPGTVKYDVKNPGQQLYSVDG